jgi:hypothetical protein
MGAKEKYGFDIRFADKNSEAVKLYCLEHLKKHGYPLDLVPSSEYWLATCRENKVYAVVGFRIIDPKTVDVPDFYIHESRWGILAAYATIEYIREFADSAGIDLLTSTPVWNTKMIDAYKKTFGVTEPTHYIFRYSPKGK